MKGLLLKDIMLLKGQKSFFLIIGLVVAGILGYYGSPDFAISYASILCATFTLTTISYDKYENGLPYLLTLPVSRKAYVKEKYLFGAAMSGVALLAVSAAAWVAVSLRRMDYPVEEWAWAVAASILCIDVYLGLCIPLQLKFEADRGKIAMGIVLGAIGALVFMAAKIGESFGVSADAVFAKLESMSYPQLLAAGALITAAAAGASYLASLRIMEKKEL